MNYKNYINKQDEAIKDATDRAGHQRDGSVAFGAVGKGLVNSNGESVFPSVPVLKDSGDRRQYESGAVRDRAVGKGRFDLIPSQAMFRLARHFEAGAIKYSDRNWEKGMPISVYVDAALRHIEKYKDGWNDEDHLAAVLWNIASIMHHEQKMPDLMDLPDRMNENLQKWVIFKPEDA